MLPNQLKWTNFVIEVKIKNKAWTTVTESIDSVNCFTIKLSKIYTK